MTVAAQLARVLLSRGRKRADMARRATKGDEDLRWWGGRPRPTNCVFNLSDLRP